MKRILTSVMKEKASLLKTFKIPGIVLFGIILYIILKFFHQEIISTFIILAVTILGSFRLFKESARGILKKQFALDYIAILAILVSVITGEYVVAGILALMITSARTLEDYGVAQAKKSLTKLADRIPNEVILWKNNMIGARLRNNKVKTDDKKLVQKMHAQGYEFENHSYCHENFKKLYKSGGKEAIKNNLVKNDQIIFKATGEYSRFFRPPFWAINKELRSAITASGYRVMMIGDPDINTLDYDDYANHRFGSVLLDRVWHEIGQEERRGRMSHVLVFHESALTRDTLKALIPELKAEGYKFVTLEKLFKKKSAPYGSGMLCAEEIPKVSVPRARPAKIPVRAVYLSVDDVSTERRVAVVEKLVSSTPANAVVIDYKVGRPLSDRWHDGKYPLSGVQS